MSEVSRLEITNPINGHVHLRQDDMLRVVTPYSQRQFAAFLVMCNTDPIIATHQQAAAYRQKILDSVKDYGYGVPFVPMMTLYLTEQTDPADVSEAFLSGVCFAVKWYVAGATTNSDKGVRDIRTVSRVLATMEEIGMPLCIHGEKTHYNDGRLVDVFDREEVFLCEELPWLLESFPGLKIVLEHITTKEACDALRMYTDRDLWATVTPQHLLIDRNDILANGIYPHNYCKPIAKRLEHRLALRELVCSGFDRVGLGTDSAPHVTHTKEAACGCAGCFTEPYALELYAQAFDEEDALEHFPAFATRMRELYQPKLDFSRTVVLERRPQHIVRKIADGKVHLTPFWAEKQIPWTVVSFS